MNKCFKMFFQKKKTHTHTIQKKDVGRVASVRARARGRLGMRVWGCVGAYESETFFFHKKIKRKNFWTNMFLVLSFEFSVFIFSFSFKVYSF